VPRQVSSGWVRLPPSKRPERARRDTGEDPSIPPLFFDTRASGFSPRLKPRGGAERRPSLLSPMRAERDRTRQRESVRRVKRDFAVGHDRTAGSRWARVRPRESTSRLDSPRDRTGARGNPKKISGRVDKGCRLCIVRQFTLACVVGSRDAWSQADLTPTPPPGEAFPIVAMANRPDVTP